MDRKIIVGLVIVCFLAGWNYADTYVTDTYVSIGSDTNITTTDMTLDGGDALLGGNQIKEIGATGTYFDVNGQVTFNDTAAVVWADSVGEAQSKIFWENGTSALYFKTANATGSLFTRMTIGGHAETANIDISNAILRVSEIETASGDLTLDPSGGQVIIDGNNGVGPDLQITGEDLVIGRSDEANTFLAVVGGNASLYGVVQAYYGEERSGSAYVGMYHNGSDALIESTLGDVNLNAQSGTIHILGDDVELDSNKYLQSDYLNLKILKSTGRIDVYNSTDENVMSYDSNTGLDLKSIGKIASDTDIILTASGGAVRPHDHGGTNLGTEAFPWNNIYYNGSLLTASKGVNKKKFTDRGKTPIGVVLDMSTEADTDEINHTTLDKEFKSLIIENVTRCTQRGNITRCIRVENNSKPESVDNPCVKWATQNVCTNWVTQEESHEYLDMSKLYWSMVLTIQDLYADNIAMKIEMCKKHSSFSWCS